jgi:cytidylate kinase
MSRGTKMNIVITVSRQLGSNGSYIAAEVAQKLDLRYLDREILHRAAEIAGFPDQTMLAKLESQEQRRGILKRVLDSLPAASTVPKIPSATLREYVSIRENPNYLSAFRETTAEQNTYKAENYVLVDRKRAQAARGYIHLVEQVLLEFAEKGNALIVGRGGQVILKDMPNALHVSIVAPEAVRIPRVAQRMDIDQKEARRRVQASDRERADYYRRFEKVDWDDPTLYDLVLNTARIPEEYAIATVCEAARRLAS